MPAPAVAGRREEGERGAHIACSGTETPAHTVHTHPLHTHCTPTRAHPRAHTRAHLGSHAPGAEVGLLLLGLLAPSLR
eukprot:2107445-Rhodomonas_salina.1